MMRWGGRVLALVVLIAMVLIGAVQWGSGGDSQSDSARIVDYDAEFVAERDGRLAVTETLRVAFPVARHGIFRFFDLRDPSDSRVRLRPEQISVTRDGRPEPFEVLTEGRGRYRNVKIGSAAVTMTGEHEYVIRYAVDGAFSSTGTAAGDETGAGDRAEFYWDLVPAGWRMPIEQARLTVRLPVPVAEVECAVGVGATDGCSAEPTTDGFVVTPGALAPNTPVTVRTTLDLPAPTRAREAWPLRWDPVLGSSVVALVVVLGLALLAGWAGALAGRRTREPKPQYPLMYAPPEGLGPAQAKYLFTEQVGEDAFVASIMQTAEKGATRLDHDAGWRITDTGDAAAWRELDPVSAYAAHVLGVQGGSFTADTSVGAGKLLKSALSGFEGATRDWARASGLITRSGIGSLAGVLVIGSFLLAGFLALFNPLDMSVLGLVPGLFAVMAMEVLLPGSSTKRTTAGRALWSRIGGFRRILATPSSESRFDFSGRRELYTAYVPWAVAFGVADAWAEKYRLETGAEPPAPHYLAATHGYAAGSLASSMAADFSATVSSAISAYEATQSSSSSGGGGFSGGGGGGGGGGGSW